MQERALRDVRVLIVEDRPIQLEALKQHLAMIDEDLRRTWGIGLFQFSLAGSVEEASGFLEMPGSFYDILVLDLELPVRKGDLNVSTENGQGFLDCVTKEKVKEVLIVSSFRDYKYVISAVRKGAVDFIAKPYRRELLQARVIESWKRVLEKDSAHLLQERIKQLVHYNERGLAYRYTVCFRNLADDVLRRTTKMEEHAYNRYGLDRKRSPEDHLIQDLVGVEDCVDIAKEEWGRLQVPSLAPGETHRTDGVEPVLHDLECTLLPCLVVKRVKLEILSTKKTVILTFKDDVRSILREILSGSLAELPDYGSPRNEPKEGRSNAELTNLIRIEVASEKGQAKVKFIDDMSPISDSDAQQINVGSFSVSQPRFSRAWGLAVMQHIAVLGAGRLIVEPQRHGNIVTFLIPLENHA
jgi:response regulator of citrate/malate metabolism